MVVRAGAGIDAVGRSSSAVWGVWEWLPRYTALHTAVALAAVLAYPLAFDSSAVLAFVAAEAMLAPRLASALLALVAYAAVLAY